MRNHPPHDMRSEKGRSGLSQRIKEQGHVIVVGKILERDQQGFYARKASLSELRGEGK